MSKTIVVTTCSASHLGQAKGMLESVLEHNPGYTVLIGLVDRLEGRVTADYYAPALLMETHELELPAFEAMLKRYDVFELSCALKSFFAAAAFSRYGADNVIFLDTDMLAFDSFRFLEQELDEHPILLTPHIRTPMPADGKRPFEREMLKNGIFNAGFFALRKGGVTDSFLKWWQERMVDQCYVNLKEGMFVDQKWLNLVPVFFPATKLLDHPGCNVAYWNLHERLIVEKEGKYFVNDQPLLFFHYSGYSMQHPETVSRHQDRIDMQRNPALVSLFARYHELLLKNGHLEKLKLEYGNRRKGFSLWRR